MADKKYNCPDCFSCQWCSDQRCRLCRGTLPSDNNRKTETERPEVDNEQSQSKDCDCGRFKGPCQKKSGCGNS